MKVNGCFIKDGYAYELSNFYEGYNNLNTIND